MRERRVGLGDPGSKLDECIRAVETGATIVVTDHGRRVARIVPDTESIEQRLAMLDRTGALAWSGRRLGARKPAVRLRDAGNVSDIIIQNRG